MVLIEKHAQEIFWLQRRIDFLNKLDDLLDEDAMPEDMEGMAKQYTKVKNASDVLKRMKEIYGSDLK